MSGKQSGLKSIAVGSKTFVDGIREKLQLGLMGRKVRESGKHYDLREQGEHYELREPEAAYNAHFTSEKALLSTENTYFWGLNVE